MKKFLDRYLFSRLGVQIFVSVLVIAIFSVIGTISHNAFVDHKEGGEYQKVMWGFKQVSSTGAAIGTIENLDKIAANAKSESAAPAMLVWSLLSWLVGLVVYSFVTGSIVNAYRNRKAKIDAGLTRYKFKDHGIIIGWDFQGIASVMAMFDIYHLKEVVILSEQSADKIRRELRQEFGSDVLGRIFIQNGSVSVSKNVESLNAYRSRAIMILGDQNDSNNDGGNVRISKIIRSRICKDVEPWDDASEYLDSKRKSRLGKLFLPDKVADGWRGKLVAKWYEGCVKKLVARRYPKRPIEIFVDISNGYNLLLSEEFPTDGFVGRSYLHVNIVNFYKATVQELFSSFAQFQEYNSPRRQGVYETSYMPLMFRRNPQANHVHIVLSGMDEMARALIVNLIPIMTDSGAENRVTVFGADKKSVAVFQGAYPLESLQNVKIDFVDSGLTEIASRELLTQIVRDQSASVTVFITGGNADAVMCVANQLPESVRYENFRLMLEQRVLSKWVRKLDSLARLGFLKVDAFGFTDRYYASIGRMQELNARLFGCDKADAPKDGAVPPLLLGHAHHKGRNCYFNESFTVGVLERSYANGLEFVYNPQGAIKPVAEVPAELREKEMRDEHIRNVNFRLLAGQRSGKRTDTERNVCAEIKPWGELPQKTKEEYAVWVNAGYAALADVFNGGEYPYALSPYSFSHVLGIIPGACPASDFREVNAFRLAIINYCLRKVRRQTFIKSKEGVVKGKTHFAILCVPEAGIAFETYRMNIDGNPMVAVLSESPEKHAAHIEDPDEREEFLQWMRHVHSYVVIEGASKDQLVDYIISRSSHLLKMKGQEVSLDVDTAKVKATLANPLLAPREVVSVYEMSGEGVKWSIAEVVQNKEGKV